MRSMSGVVFEEIANRVAPGLQLGLNSARFDLLCVPVMVTPILVPDVVIREAKGLAMAKLP